MIEDMDSRGEAVLEVGVSIAKAVAHPAGCATTARRRAGGGVVSAAGRVADRGGEVT
jgi:hypothetical protein